MKDVRYSAFVTTFRLKATWITALRGTVSAKSSRHPHDSATKMSDTSTGQVGHPGRPGPPPSVTEEDVARTREERTNCAMANEANTMRSPTIAFTMTARAFVILSSAPPAIIHKAPP